MSALKGRAVPDLIQCVELGEDSGPAGFHPELLEIMMESNSGRGGQDSTGQDRTGQETSKTGRH